MRASSFVRILVLSAAMAGYSSWSLTVREKDKDAVVPADSSAVAGIPLLSLTQARALWSDPGTVFIDVRSSADYEFGHIAGAMSMPYEEFPERLTDKKPQLQSARAIVVYCKSKDCGKSLWSAIRLHQEGLTQAKIYPNGWNEWDTHGLPRTHAGR
jgi:rhodanese-related sulfurtransferase